MQNYELMSRAYKILENEMQDGSHQNGGNYYIRNLETVILAVQEVITNLKTEKGELPF